MCSLTCRPLILKSLCAPRFGKNELGLCTKCTACLWFTPFQTNPTFHNHRKVMIGPGRLSVFPRSVPDILRKGSASPVMKDDLLRWIDEVKVEEDTSCSNYLISEALTGSFGNSKVKLSNQTGSGQCTARLRHLKTPNLAVKKCHLSDKDIEQSSSSTDNILNSDSKCQHLLKYISKNRSRNLHSVLQSKLHWNLLRSQLLISCFSNGQPVCGISTTCRSSQGMPSPKKEPHNGASSCPLDKEKFEEIEEKTLKAKKKVWEQNIWTIPNVLTVSRICLTPYLGYLVVQHQYALAGGLFIVAGLTDMLDGQIARTWPSQRSAFGSALDPLADKILISTLYVTLSVVHLIPVSLTALIFARDVCLIGAAFYVRYLSLPPPLTFSRFFDGTNVTMELKPTTISKVNTAIQLSLVCFTLAAPVFNYVDHPLLHGLWYLTAATTIWSGLGYVFRKDTYEIYKTSQEAKNKFN